MITKYTTAIVIIVIIAIGGWIIMKDPVGHDEFAKPSTPVVNTFPAPGSDVDEITVAPDAIDFAITDSAVVEVTYTRDGFSPRETTIGANTEVIFYNQSGAPMWVASNPHPIHNDYSTFDQLSIGDTYTFTFTEPGIYNYHSHLDPKTGGRIIVQ